MSTIYFSGVHGCGKSTLIKKLAEREGFLIAKKEDLPPLKTIEERQEGRLQRAYLHATENQRLQNANPDKHILCDRGSIDVLAYTYAFCRLGWTSQEYTEKYREKHRDLFSIAPKEDILILLKPPLFMVEARIKHRWVQTGYAKWNEENFKYLTAVNDQYWGLFEEHQGKKIMLEQTNLKDLESAVDQFLNASQENITPDAISHQKEYHPGGFPCS